MELNPLLTHKLCPKLLKKAFKIMKITLSLIHI